MKSTLIVGIETVVGANLAARLIDEQAVVGLSRRSRVRIDGVDIHPVPAADAAAHTLAEFAPQQVVYCGPEACSAWEADAEAKLSTESAIEAGRWAQAAHHAACGFTMISSDAVFTGPWMFHDEDSVAVCRSAAAGHIRDAEKRVRDACPAALIVRTNAFGWSPLGEEGWLETRIAEIEAHRAAGADCIRYATPILATDLAEILRRAWGERLHGVYHVAGAERVSPLQFVQRLADHFDLPWLTVRDEQQTLDECPTGFGAGETSLQTKAIRKALCVAMPMLSEGLQRLRTQQFDGFAERLAATSPAAHKVA